MTPKQRKTYDFILDFCTVKGFSPTYDEIAKAVGIKSKSSVFRLIEALDAQGLITRMPRLQRSVFPVALQEKKRKAEVVSMIERVMQAHDQGTISAREAIEQLRPIPALLGRQA